MRDISVNVPPTELECMTGSHYFSTRNNFAEHHFDQLGDPGVAPIQNCAKMGKFIFLYGDYLQMMR